MNLVLPPPPVMICPNCRKEYTRKSFYQKHIVLCDMINVQNDEEIDVPTTREIYIMMRELAKQYTSCKEECKQLKHRISILEKKTNIQNISPQDYLLKNKRCDDNFNNWIDNFDIQTKFIKQLSDSNFITILCKIIVENNNYNSPFCAFKYKNKNNVMIFNGKYWEHFTIDHGYTMIIKEIVPKLLDIILSLSDKESDTIINIITDKNYDINFHNEFKSKIFKNIQQSIM